MRPARGTEQLQLAREIDDGVVIQLDPLAGELVEIHVFSGAHVGEGASERESVQNLGPNSQLGGVPGPSNEALTRSKGRGWKAAIVGRLGNPGRCTRLTP